MLSIGLKCKPTEIIYVVLEITEDARRVIEHEKIALGDNQPLPERLHISMGRLKTLVERFKAQQLQGVGLKITEHQALRQRVNEASLHRLYLEGCCQVAVVECGMPIRTCNAQQVKAALDTSQRLEGYVAAGEFREIEGVDKFRKTGRQDWIEATAAALVVLEGQP